jgi:transcriptional regulator with XRE-family HTH domain
VINNEQLGEACDRHYTSDVEPRALQMVKITSEQVRAARGLLGWEKQDLANAAGLSVETIKGIERRPGVLMVRTSTLYAIQNAFDEAGVEIFDETNGGAGVRWKKRPLNYPFEAE